MKLYCDSCPARDYCNLLKEFRAFEKQAGNDYWYEEEIPSHFAAKCPIIRAQPDRNLG